MNIGKMRKIVFAFMAVMVFGSGCGESVTAGAATEVSVQETLALEDTASTEIKESGLVQAGTGNAFSLSDVPGFSDEPYVAINGNVPYFTDDEVTAESFESYSSLDDLGRCGAAFASVGQDLMPTEERGAIGQVKPTGWHTVKYDIVDGKYLYNRCHLIGYQLTAENANEENLITGTRYLNIDGMLPFENMVADYVKETGNHVMYRVTPVFEGDNLLASGVLMEGMSAEDNGEGILFCVYAYNAQPGVIIDYATGDSSLADGWTAETEAETVQERNTAKDSAAEEVEIAEGTYVLNTNTMKFHLPTCSSAKKISEKNRKESDADREELIAEGYAPCKECNP